jgi:hypothetical protein
MSKGIKSRQNNPYSVRTRENVNEYFSSGGDVGGSNSSNETVKTCWDFELISPTSEIKVVKQNDKVKGSIDQSQKLVLIRFGSKPLGYAPPNKSFEIIEASKLKTGYLVGEITSKTEDNQNASIHLCLK